MNRTPKTPIVAVLGATGLLLAVPPAGQHAAAGGSPAPADAPVAILHTTAGDVVFRLRPDWAPNTVRRFIENCRRGVYEDIALREAYDGQLLAGALQADGSPKWTQVAWPVAQELHAELANQRGVVGIRPWPRQVYPDSYEFYVCMEEVRELDGQRTLFAEVVDGMSILDDVAASADADGIATYLVTINSVEIVQN